jgi:histidine ammonia-lyase
VLGAVSDALDHIEGVVESELNGLSDNPLLFDGQWLEAGNFHGASLAMAMDHLRIALAQLATISERRTYRLTHGDLSPNLPSFLVPGTGLNSGFMLAQYTAASLASEVKGFAHPASVDSIPTIQHHEDHNSMAPIAARLALRSVECVADIVGIEMLLAAQALDLCERGLEWEEEGQSQRIEPSNLAPRIATYRDRIRVNVDFWEDDGVLHPELEAMGRMVRKGEVLGDQLSW